MTTLLEDFLSAETPEAVDTLRGRIRKEKLASAPLYEKIGKTVGAGAAETVSALPETLGALVGSKTIEQAGIDFGDFLEDDVIGEVDPEFSKSLGGQIARGIGQVGGMFVGGGVGGVAGRALMASGKAAKAAKAAHAAKPTIETAKTISKLKEKSFGRGAALTTGASGFGLGGKELKRDLEQTRLEQGRVATAEEKSKAAFWGGVIGISEMLPLYSLAKRGGFVGRDKFEELAKEASKKVGKRKNEIIKGIGKGAAAQGASEALQEGAQNTLMNLYAQANFDQERKLFDQLEESAAAGGGVGVILGAVTGWLGAKRGIRIQQEEQARVQQEVQRIEQEEAVVAEQEAAAAEEADFNRAFDQAEATKRGNTLSANPEERPVEVTDRRLYVSLKEELNIQDNDDPAFQRFVNSYIPTPEEARGTGKQPNVAKDWEAYNKGYDAFRNNKSSKGFKGQKAQGYKDAKQARLLDEKTQEAIRKAQEEGIKKQREGLVDTSHKRTMGAIKKEKENFIKSQEKAAAAREGRIAEEDAALAKQEASAEVLSTEPDYIKTKNAVDSTNEEKEIFDKFYTQVQNNELKATKGDWKQFKTGYNKFNNTKLLNLNKIEESLSGTRLAGFLVAKNETQVIEDKYRDIVSTQTLELPGTQVDEIQEEELAPVSGARIEAAQQQEQESIPEEFQTVPDASGVVEEEVGTLPEEEVSTLTPIIAPGQQEVTLVPGQGVEPPISEEIERFSRELEEEERALGTDIPPAQEAPPVQEDPDNISNISTNAPTSTTPNVNLSRTEGIPTDTQADTSKPAITGQQHTFARAKLNRLNKRITGSDVKIIYHENTNTLPETDLTYIDSKKIDHNNVRGYINNDTNTIHIVGGNLQKKGFVQDLERLVSHELIGHHGFYQLFKPKDLDPFLDRSYFMLQNDKLLGEIESIYKIDTSKIEDRRTAVKEYIANLAEDPNRNLPLWKRVIAKFRHLLRKLGLVNLSDNDIRDMLMTAGDRLGLNVDPTSGSQRAQTQEQQDIDFSLNTNIDTNISLAEQKQQESKDMPTRLRQSAVGGFMNDINNFQETFSTFTPATTKQRARSVIDTDLKQGWWQNYVDRLAEATKELSPIQALTTYGNVRGIEDYKRIRGMALGIKHPFESVAEDLRKIMIDRKGPITAAQLEELSNYYRTEGVDVNTLSFLTEKEREITEKSKQRMRELEALLISLGGLNADRVAALRGATGELYMPRLFMEYMLDPETRNVRGGKRLSPRDWMKKRDSDLTDEHIKALRVIEDPRILAISHLSVVGKDAALLQMFNQMQENGEGVWLWSSPNLEAEGQAKKFAGDQTMDLVSSLRRKLKQERASRGTPNYQAFITESQNMEETIRNNIRNRLPEIQNLPIVQDMVNQGINMEDYIFNSMMSGEFVPLKGKQYGQLNGSFVHKSLKDDLQELAGFVAAGESPMEKMFAKGGYMDDATRIWKRLKTVANPPTHFVNMVGNWYMLDTSTSTNSLTIVKDLLGVVNETANPDKAAREFGPMTLTEIATKTGILDTSFTAAEAYKAKSLASKINELVKEVDTAQEGKLRKLQFRIAFGWRDIWDGMAELYQKEEEVFKIVKMKDYLRQWEKAHGVKLKTLYNQDKAAATQVYSRAAVEAQNSLIDYSAVPQWVRELRRTPIAPFITFPYKVFPIMVRNTLKHPIKTAQWAMVPAMMSAMMAGEDFDEDDLKKIQERYPSWSKEKLNMFMIPYKKDNGDLGVMHIDKFFPPAMFMNMVSKIANDPVELTGLQKAGEVLGSVNDLGLFAGPAIDAVAALATNKNTFTGQDIVPEFATPYEQANALAAYLGNMTMPTWLTESGFRGHVFDKTLGEELDPVTGKVTESWGQVSGRLFGVNIHTLNLQKQQQNNIKFYTNRIRKTKQVKAKVLRDRNLQANPEKQASLIKDYNIMLARFRQERNEYLQKSQ